MKELRILSATAGPNTYGVDETCPNKVRRSFVAGFPWFRFALLVNVIIGATVMVLPL